MNASENWDDDHMEFDFWQGEPRDIQWIQPFCDRLAKAWAKRPDWRFGQLMVNLLRDYEAEYGRDFFFLEEEEMIEVIEAYCARFVEREYHG